jgi:hypothetical protein
MTRLRARPLAALVAGVLLLGCADVREAEGHQPAWSTPTQPARTMKIRMTIDGTPVAATLDDSEAARDFASLLPLTLTLEDYASTEKVAYLPRKLATAGAPKGTDPDVGDITYYAPWGNLALFYRDFGYSAGLVKLGRLDGGVEILQRGGALEARIERMEE